MNPADRGASTAPGPGRGARHRRPRAPVLRRDPRKAVLTWFVIPVLTALLLFVGAIEIGPAVAAAEGHGTPGYFVAKVEHCSKGGCGWTGDFVASDGRVVRQGVSFNGPHGTLYQGARLAALDTGDAGSVFARQGSRDWIGDLAAIVAGAIGFGLWAWRVPYKRLRQRVRGDKFLIPSA